MTPKKMFTFLLLVACWVLADAQDEWPVDDYEDDLSFFRRLLNPIVTRAMSIARQAGSPALTNFAIAALGTFSATVFAPFFLLFILRLYLFPAVAAFGKKRKGRDLTDLDRQQNTLDFDGDWLAKEAQALVALSARFEGYLRDFESALKNGKFGSTNTEPAPENDESSGSEPVSIS